MSTNTVTTEIIVTVMMVVTFAWLGAGESVLGVGLVTVPPVTEGETERVGIN